MDGDGDGVDIEGSPQPGPSGESTSALSGVIHTVSDENDVGVETDQPPKQQVLSIVEVLYALLAFKCICRQHLSECTIFTYKL